MLSSENEPKQKTSYMDLIFHFRFDEQLYRDQAKLQLEVALDRDKHSVTKYWIFIVSSYIMGAIFLGLIGNGGALVAGSLFCLIGTIFLIIFLNYHSKVKKAITEYEAQLSKEANRLKETDNAIELHLTDELFSYKDGDVASSARWKLFKSFLIIGDFLLLIVDDNVNFSAFYIHKSQVGAENFQEISTFVASSLKPYPYKHRYQVKH